MNFPPKDTGNDIEILGFVKRDSFIVLQTTHDYFENLSNPEKLKTISMIIRSLEALHFQIEKEINR